MTPIEFRGDLWHQKTRVPGLSCGVVYVILRLAVLVELRLVTDTDRQTDRHRHGHRHRPMASTADASQRAVTKFVQKLRLRIAIIRSAWRQPNISKHTSTVSCDLVLKIFLNVQFMT